jgi:16S rRNA (guanine966-N2)-methyltransferase
MQITGGKFNSRKIKTETFVNIKPTLSKIRQSTFNMLVSLFFSQETLDASEVFNGKSFLDMFSGSGIMSLEAFSRGFSPVIAFEKDFKTATWIEKTFNEFEKDSVMTSDLQVFKGDSLSLIKKISQTFDVIFIDPPYDSDLYKKSIDTIVSEKKLNSNGVIILESSVGKEFSLENPLKLVKQKVYGNTKVSILQIS